MPEFFLELFSEEIPARMQVAAARDLGVAVKTAFAPLGLLESDGQPLTFSGPRRIAVSLPLSRIRNALYNKARGPRIGASDQAINGFLSKYGATRENLTQIDGYHVVEVLSPEIATREIIVQLLPALLRKFSWPKSMRWGGTSAFTWVRPLRRIVCLFDGDVVPFTLRDGDDDGHGLVAGNLTEGHRFLAPDEFVVNSADDWRIQLQQRRVMVKADDRVETILTETVKLALANGYNFVTDEALLQEVAGLVEWPFPKLGKIDSRFMDLPAEVMQVSMKVNQRYFVLRNPDGTPAPAFAFVANVPGADGGAEIVKGNERVLRARFSDARYFWDLDRRSRLDSRVSALDNITFHAKLGTQGQRVNRIIWVARSLARALNLNLEQADRAARLCKADLTTGMVGEFPELQGIMGGYYAAHDGEADAVCEAVRDHYRPQGPHDELPGGEIGLIVAAADKINTLVGFFAVDERPTGSGDPYALRRAALGLVRIIRERNLRVRLGLILNEAAQQNVPYKPADDVLEFIFERLRVQLRTEGARHDVLNAVLGAGSDDDLVRILARTDAVAGLLGTEDGANLLGAYRRAANILRIEEKKDGPHDGAVDPTLLQAPEEQALAAALDNVAPSVTTALANEDFTAAMAEMARLRPPVDAFFVAIQVNADDAALRQNRLRLLARLRGVMNQVADFSRIDG